MTSFSIHSEAALKQLAHVIAPHLSKGDAVLLEGDLGSGKTAFCRHLIRTLLNDEQHEVPSPTFTLVQTYDAKAFPIWHFDCYRLDSAEEGYALGIEEAFSEAVSLIEWPGIITPLLPKETLLIEIACSNTLLMTNTEFRTITLSGSGRWSSLILDIRKEFYHATSLS